MLLRGERLYEESLGNDRRMVECALQKFDDALNTRDNAKIEEAREEFRIFLKKFSEEI